MNTVIAVLSTIILAVTILTLLLGIFAYIVYKTRKRGVRPKQIQPEKPIEVVKEPKPVPEEKTAVPSPPESSRLEERTIQPPSPPVEETPSLIRRYEPEKKKEKRAEWR